MNLRTEKFIRSAMAAAGAASLLSSPLAFSAGFEKTVIWSGKWAPLAGAAVGAVSGAQSLYFNPAGIAAGHGLEVSANFSPIFGKFNGPLSATNLNAESSRKLSPAFGVMANYNYNEKLGFAIGAYVSGGTKAVYENAALTPALNADVIADLAVVEYSLGAAYELIDGLRVGAAYRIVHVGASLASVSRGNGSAFAPFTLDSLSGTRYNGFRAGIQYAPHDGTWGLGASWRSQVDFTVTGSGSGRFVTNPTTFTTVPTTIADASASGVFPQEVNIGGFLEFIPKNTVFAQYTFQEYHKNQTLSLVGTIAGPNAPTSTFLTDIPQNWLNVHIGRIGYQFSGIENWALRAGYAITTKATPESDPRATFSSPATGHTVALGVGTSFLDKMLDLDVGADYSWAKANLDATQVAPGNVAGEYGTNSFAIHLGGTFHM